MDLDAGGQDVRDVLVQDVLGQAVVGDAVAQHAAQLGPLLVHSHLVPHEGQVIGRGQAAGAAADDGHGLSGSFGAGGRLHRLGVVNRKALQTADVDGVVHHPAAALGLAGVLAHIGAGGGERIVLPDQLDRVVVPALPDQRHIAGHIHMGGTGGDARHGVAQAADAAAVEDVLLIVLPEATDALEHHVGPLVADGAVGGIGDDLGGALDQVDGLQGGGAVQHLLDQVSQLVQAHAAGHALAAGLGVAQAQIVQGNVHRTQARGAGTDPPLHVPVESAQDGLRPSRRLDG